MRLSFASTQSLDSIDVPMSHNVVAIMLSLKLLSEAPVRRSSSSIGGLTLLAVQPASAGWTFGGTVRMGRGAARSGRVNRISAPGGSRIFLKPGRGSVAALLGSGSSGRVAMAPRRLGRGSSMAPVLWFGVPPEPPGGSRNQPEVRGTQRARPLSVAGIDYITGTNFLDMLDNGVVVCHLARVIQDKAKQAVESGAVKGVSTDEGADCCRSPTMAVARHPVRLQAGHGWPVPGVIDRETTGDVM